MKLKEKKYLSKLIDKYEKKDSTKYLLSPNSFSNEDIINGIKILLSKRITMSEVTKKFEFQKVHLKSIFEEFQNITKNLDLRKMLKF